MVIPDYHKVFLSIIIKWPTFMRTWHLASLGSSMIPELVRWIYLTLWKFFSKIIELSKYITEMLLKNSNLDTISMDYVGTSNAPHKTILSSNT